jgi:NAD(P)-dependent dehydrogenase (short-subunit alcohol dehydrogenase family)
VGHFLLTTLLLDKVKAAEQARIVNVSSLAHENAKMDLDDYHCENKKYVAWPVY